MVTMGDIAKKAGVSIVTVSKALNNKDGVSESLKNKIQTMALEMGYRMNGGNRTTRSGLTNSIVIVIPERFAGDEQAFYLKFYRQIIHELESYQYYGILQMLSFEDEENGILPRAIADQKADGVIMLGQPSQEYVSHLKAKEIPTIYLDFYMEGLEGDIILTDNYFAMYEMTNYLISQGHREIGFVGNVHATSSIQDRFLGMYKSLLEHRLTFDHRYLVSDRDDSGMFIPLQVPEDLPTAFVCNCDYSAYLFIQKLTEAGIRVPEDCSIVGFDNDIYATLADPALTTVKVDIEEMAAVAAKQVVEKVELEDGKANYNGRIFVRGSIVYRDSVKTI